MIFFGKCACFLRIKRVVFTIERQKERKMNNCPKCGTKFKGNYCPNCGTAIAHNNCPKCKAPLTEGAKFCANCGRSLQKKEKPVWLKKTVSYCKGHAQTLFASTFLFIAVVLACVLPFVGGRNIFKAEKVATIHIGDDKATVEMILGTPTERTNESWHYLQRNAEKIYLKMNELKEPKEDSERFAKDLEMFNKLRIKFEKMTYSYIKVSFDENEEVTEVFLDRKHHYDAEDDYAGEKKYAKKITTDPKEIEVSQAKFDGETQYEILTKISALIYTVKYSDKSFYRKAMGSATTELFADGKACTVKWSDVLGEHKITLPTKVMEGDFILSNESGSFKVNSLGTLLSYEGDSETLVIPEGITVINSNVFQNHTEITSITIPESVTKIESDAFSNCTGIRSATLPASAIDYIRKDNLQTVFITGGSSIGYSAFASCSELTTVTILDGVTSIGNRAFFGCSELTTISIPDSVKSVGSEAFKNTQLLYNDYDNAYYLGNENNPYVVLMKPMNTSIGSCVIHSRTKAIAEEAFKGCVELTSITIPDGVTSIGYLAFEHCEGLTTVTIPDGVTSIGNRAFFGCSELTTISIPDSVKSVGLEAFKHTQLLYNDYDNAYYLGNENNPYVVLMKPMNTLIGSCVIHSRTKAIAEEAFKGCVELTSITIPDGVTSIGNFAFEDCEELTSVIIPDGVTSIGDFAFWGCRGLTSITIPDSVTSIGSGAFSRCFGLTSVTIPDSVTSIGNFAFEDCDGLTSVTIPNSVTSIEDYAFRGCTGLTSITFQGTKEQWNAINKWGNWNFNTGNYTVYCTDGEITK